MNWRHSSTDFNRRMQDWFALQRASRVDDAWPGGGGAVWRNIHVVRRVLLMMWKKSLVLLPFLALSAAGQEIPWQDFALGDRVEVTLGTGAPLTGRLAAPSPKVSSVDYTQASI